MQLRLLIWLAGEPALLGPWLTLALTYFAHSLVWAGAAALIVRSRKLDSAARNFYWRVALFGPLLSAAAAAASTGGLERTHSSAPAYVRELAVPLFAATERASAAAPPLLMGLSGEAQRQRSQIRSVAALGLAAAALGLLRFLGAALLLRRRLGARRPLTDARLLARFELMRAQTALRRIALTQSDAVVSPLVIGNAEVCLPRASLAELTDAELDTVFCHELAHIERRDGLWFPLVATVESLLWLHPLNHWLSARFRDSAEHACDDRAIEITGNPLALARALLHVASAAPFAGRLSMTPTMASSRHSLLPRVRRLTTAPPPIGPRTGRRGRAWAIVTISALGASLSSLSIRGAYAQASVRVAAAPVACLPSSASETTAGDVEYSQSMAELAQRGQRVADQLAAVEQLPSTNQDRTPEAVRVLELGQELRHIRATQAWLEERFVASSRCTPSTARRGAR